MRGGIGEWGAGERSVGLGGVGEGGGITGVHSDAGPAPLGRGVGAVAGRQDRPLVHCGLAHEANAAAWRAGLGTVAGGIRDRDQVLGAGTGRDGDRHRGDVGERTDDPAGLRAPAGDTDLDHHLALARPMPVGLGAEVGEASGQRDIDELAAEGAGISFAGLGVIAGR